MLKRRWRRHCLKIGKSVLHGRSLLIPTLFPSVDGAKFREDILKRLPDFLKVLFVHSDLSVAGSALGGTIARPCSQDNAASAQIGMTALNFEHRRPHT